MEDGPTESSIDFIPAICFVKRGITKNRLEKVVLTAEELARVIKETREQISSDEENSGEETNDELEDDDAMDVSEVARDEFNFDDYDNDAEEGVQVAAIGDVAVIDENVEPLNDEDDSEAEDEVIQDSDNIVLVGHVVDDAASLEVWVFNDEEESLYVHHDFFLPSFPLCIEWLNYDPASDKSGNMCAIGGMTPIITIWDLDIQDSMEPAFKLGSRKKNSEKFGHSDAVLDLSWNTHFPHILASASVDKTVILWDLDEGRPHTTITSFSEKVQSIEFHPTEAQKLLTGCADGKIRIFDCSSLDVINSSYVEWNVNVEVEKVLWNPTDPNYFIAGTNDGKLHYADVREANKFVWSIDAHCDEISGICFNTESKELLCTTGVDGLLKIWKFNETTIREVYSHDFALGRIQCMKQSPDDPYALVFGGEKPPRCRVYNIKNFEAVRATFGIENAE